MLKKLTPQQIEQFLGVGLQKAIADKRLDLEEMEALAGNSKPKQSAKRGMSPQHRLKLAQSMKLRWREAKKAGKKRLT